MTDKFIKHPFLQVLEKTFSASIQTDLDLSFFPYVEDDKRWLCFSDYCVDDKTKPNDVITFTFMPNRNDYELISSHLKLVVPNDIKKVKTISKPFIHFLLKHKLVNFSFVINDREKFFGKDHQELKQAVLLVFEQAKNQYKLWIKNEPDKSDHYNDMIRKLEALIRNIKIGKKLKQIYLMFLTTYLGGFISSLIVKRTRADSFVWFSDRDAINDVGDLLSVDMFQHFMVRFGEISHCKFGSSYATSRDILFYEEFLRIPDYIAGTIADYNLENNQLSKEKFTFFLKEYMADNNHNNFVFSFRNNDKEIICERIKFRNME